jgi:ribosomal protein L7Ae-like RNA K-turn-binding protein
VKVMQQIRYYILFPSHTEGIKLESVLKKEKIKYTIVPTPRELSASCGIAIMYNKEDEERIRYLIDIHKVKTSGLHSVEKKIINPYLGV